ncbi:hypothetical protein [Mycobacterium sp. OTB74]|uniref:hypothetical protein n=1 Tax=Mycobacterium sp. OTB74 TaxID=1853452 RepID=UPI002476C622|nr:hypothetical protein [Mycobacterium sp. OTB74]
MDWDEEFDVLCVGAGIGGLATAIVAADADAEVMVVGAGRFADGRWDYQPSAGPEVRTLGNLVRSWTDADRPQEQPQAPPSDDESGEVTPEEATSDYFAALIEELVPAGDQGTSGPTSGAVPCRQIRELSAAESNSRTVETFIGERIADWAQECLGSAAGAVYTTVRGWTSETMKDVCGQTVKVAPVDAVEAGPGVAVRDVFDRLMGAAADRDIAVSSQSTLQSLVFDGGRVVGAVLDTPVGRNAVRVRHSVVFSPDFADYGEAVEELQDPAGEYVVAIVGSPASRFARVELVAQ